MFECMKSIQKQVSSVFLLVNSNILKQLYVSAAKNGSPMFEISVPVSSFLNDFFLFGKSSHLTQIQGTVPFYIPWNIRKSLLSNRWMKLKKPEVLFIIKSIVDRKEV